MNVGCSSVSHFAQRVIDVAFVELVIPCAINDWLAERFVGPFHTSRLGVDVASQNDNVCVRCGRFEWGELVVQIRVSLDFHDFANFKSRIEYW
ncbi:hypothetical protein D3C72_2192560 [compost metagenome]